MEGIREGTFLIGPGVYENTMSEIVIRLATLLLFYTGWSLPRVHMQRSANYTIDPLKMQNTLSSYDSSPELRSSSFALEGPSSSSSSSISSSLTLECLVEVVGRGVSASFFFCASFHACAI